MSDQFSSFMDERSKANDSFNKYYRAIVTETNDPLQMHRVRFKCPDIHDYSLKDEECPWAVVSERFGGRRAGEWHSPCKGDWVIVTFDRGHVYAPIVVGYCNPTRRKLYPHASLYGMTPLPVDENGDPAEQPNDVTLDYYPKDGRPMSQGVQDRYGSLDVINSTGFFPSEHREAPPSPDHDAISQKDFKQSSNKPIANDPDTKYMMRLSKYGHLFLMGDQGYAWKKDGDFGEFTGDFTEDEEYEVKRWKYINKLVNEDNPSGHDQRRMLLQTRYGHKIEMRDVGWAQKGPTPSKTRDGEYGDPRTISNEEAADQRWLKMRTKGGMLFQMSDVGTHPNDDEYVKRLLEDEIGDKADGENKWAGRDSRFIRLVSRHGYKIAIDDRGASDIDSSGKENPHGNGVLIKGRRSPGSQGVPSEGDQRGYFWEFNENDSINQTTWGSPTGQILQINDKHQYIMMSSRKPDYPTSWKNLDDNEFLLNAISAGQHEDNSHTFKIDMHNEYIRMKTRSGKGSGPLGDPVNFPGVVGDVNQGLECRDGSQGDDPWVELVDSQDRNLWFWGKGELVMCHARRQPDPVDIMWWMDEKRKELIIKHDEESGRIQITCNKPIEIISAEDVNINAARSLNLAAGTDITLSVNSTKFKLDDSGIGYNGDMEGPQLTAKMIDMPRHPTIEPLDPPQIAVNPKMSPGNRGKRYNESLDAPADQDEITHSD